MTTSTLTLQNGTSNTNDLTNKTTVNGRTYTNSFADQINGKTGIELNGEDFVLLGVSSPAPKFANTKAKGTKQLFAYKKPNESKESNELQEMGGNMLASSILALLPMGHLLEQFKTIMEMAHKSREESGTKIGINYTQNINPNAAIKPNEAFLPHSPFRIEPPKAPSLWDRVKKEAAQLNETKKKKKAAGLGSF